MSTLSAGDKLRIGILGSGSGTNLDVIFRLIHDRMLPAEVKVVVSDLREAGILQIGRAHRVQTKYVYPGEAPGVIEPASEHNIVNALQQQHVELVLLLNFGRTPGRDLLGAFPDRVLGIHPSLLPRYPGPRAWEDALAAGDAVTGCTVYRVGADGCSVGTIAQAEVDILAGDTPDMLRDRIRQAENILYPAVVEFFARERPLGG
ncbi:MAG: formyltransferase family protein [Verrucomicrobia bacterium]|nr:formyltransferase family protein [Verrucomicrobiota bacterium]